MIAKLYLYTHTHTHACTHTRHQNKKGISCSESLHMDNNGQYTITHHVGYLCRSIPRCAWWLFSDGPYRRLCEAHSGSGRVCHRIRTQACNVVCSAPDTDILLHPFLDQPHSAFPNHSTYVHRAQENHSDQRTLQRHGEGKRKSC